MIKRKIYTMYFICYNRSPSMHQPYPQWRDSNSLNWTQVWKLVRDVWKLVRDHSYRWVSSPSVGHIRYMFVIIIVLLLLMFHLYSPSKALDYGPPFCCRRPHNQLTILTTKMYTGQTIPIARLNRMLLQKNYQLVFAMEDKRQVQSSLNRVSAMSSCRCWGGGKSMEHISL